MVIKSGFFARETEMPSKSRRRAVHDDLDFGFYFVLAFMAAIPLVLVYVNDLLTSTQPLSKATTVHISGNEFHI